MDADAAKENRAPFARSGKSKSGSCFIASFFNLNPSHASFDLVEERVLFRFALRVRVIFLAERPDLTPVE